MAKRAEFIVSANERLPIDLIVLTNVSFNYCPTFMFPCL
jgi:hypothetical protein